jgi:hypothetical protein
MFKFTCYNLSVYTKNTVIIEVQVCIQSALEQDICNLYVLKLYLEHANLNIKHIDVGVLQVLHYTVVQCVMLIYCSMYQNDIWTVC